MSKAGKSIEEKMAELREMVRWFESDEFVLEQAAEKFEAAATLAKTIESDLVSLQNTVTVLKESFEKQ